MKEIDVKWELLNGMRCELKVKQEEYEGLEADLEQCHRAYAQKWELNGIC